MCGIGAFQIVGGECDPAMVARVLLRLLEVRGRDASGVAWHADGQTYVHKAALSGSVFARQLDKCVGTTGIVHTRWATQGNPRNNGNNHPIDVGGVVGVHNGHCSNDNELLRKCDDYKRKAQVDSEAIFAYIAHAPKGVKLRDRLAAVRGGAALFWLRSHDKHERLHIARLQSSPLVLGETKGGSLIGASTEGILRETAKRCKLTLELVHTLPEGTYVRAEGGRLHEWMTVPVQRSWTTVLPDYTKPSSATRSTRRPKHMPAPLSAADQQTLDALLAAEDEVMRNAIVDQEIADHEADMLETDTLRDALDRQFRMGRYGDRY